MRHWTRLTVLYIVLTAMSVVRMNASYQSCYTVQKAGLGDGYYELDPEQDGRDEFTVYCNTSSTPACAVLHHNWEAHTTHVTGYESSGSFIAQVNYNNGLTAENVRSVVMTSSYCQHVLEMTCRNAHVDDNWWESYYGNQRKWESLGGTFCIQANSHRAIDCSCFQNIPTIKTDQGEVGNWVLFPITAFFLGNTGPFNDAPDNEWIDFQLGPMRCLQVWRIFQKFPGKRKTIGVILVGDVKTTTYSAMACLSMSMNCVGFNIQTNPVFFCELVSVPADAHGSIVVDNESWSHYYIAV